MANLCKFKIKIFFPVILILIAFAVLNLVFVQPVEAANQPHKYQIRVDLTENLVFIDVWNSDLQGYAITDHVFLCSPGMYATPTPTGIFTAKPRAIDWTYDPQGTGEWERFRSWGHCYVNGTTTITGAYLFHSIPSTKPEYGYVNQRDIDLMGSRSSHGCVRLWPRQSTWIRKNCDGSRIWIYYGDGNNEKFWRLREDLKQEAPPKELWPNTLITEKTKYIYTYFGDTLEGLAEMAGITADKLIAMNPGIDLTGEIEVGLAIKIK